MSPPVNDAQLAKLLNRTTRAISQAADSGRITRRPDGLFDPEQAIAEFQATTMHERGHNNKLMEIPTAEIPSGEKAKGTDYAKARAGEKIYEALLKKLRYEERAKNLTPTRDVADAAFASHRTLRDACFNIPTRIAPQLAAEPSIERCQQILEREISAVFTAFADGKL